MTNGQSSVGSESDGAAAPLSLEALRERVVARRRNSPENRPQNVDWVVVRTRRQRMQIIAVCTGALLLMAIGLYFGLTHQEAAPVDSAAPAPAAVVGVA